MAKISIYFDVRQINKNALASVYLRLNIRSKQRYYLIATASPNQWDYKKNLVKKNLPISRDKNNLICKFKNDAEKILLDYSLQRKNITFQEFEKYFFAPKDNTKSFYEFVDDLRVNFIVKKFSKGTVHIYKTQVSKMKRFKSELCFHEIDTAFIRSYEAYMYSELSNKKSTANKSLIWFKSALNKAIENEIIEENPFKGIKLKRVTGIRTALSLNEVDKLVKLYSTKQLPKGQQITLRHFLFCCYTGISFIDFVNLTKDNFKTLDGKEFVVSNRKKTDNPINVPLAQKAKELLKEEDHFKTTVFDTFADQTYNKHLKKIMKTANIDKSISFHCSRHTFATVGYNRLNVPMEVISKILAHSNIKTTMIYAQIDNEKLHSEVMKWDKI